MVLFRDKPLLTLIWHKAHCDQRPHIFRLQWCTSYLHDKDLFIYKIICTVALEPFIRLNVILYCGAPVYALLLRSKTPLAGHDHLITPNTEFLMGRYGSHSPAAVRSEQTGGIGFCQVTVYTGKIDLLIPHLYPVCEMEKATGNKSLSMPYQSDLDPNVLVEWLGEWRHLWKAINFVQGEAKANFNSPQRNCCNRLAIAAS